MSEIPSEVPPPPATSEAAEPVVTAEAASDTTNDTTSDTGSIDVPTDSTDGTTDDWAVDDDIAECVAAYSEQSDNPEPPPAPREAAGTDQHLVDAAANTDGEVGTQKLEELGSAKLSDEFAAAAAGKDIETSDTVGTGSLSANPEQAGNQLAAVREQTMEQAAAATAQAELQAELDRQQHADAAQEAAFQSKLDDGTGVGKFKYGQTNDDGSVHVTYYHGASDSEHIESLPDDHPMQKQNIGVHSSWDEFADGRRENAHMTDHDAVDENENRQKPVDL